MFVPLSGLSRNCSRAITLRLRLFHDGQVDTSCLHARLGTGGWLILTGYGLPVNFRLTGHYIRDAKLRLAYQRLGQPHEYLQNGSGVNFCAWPVMRCTRSGISSTRASSIPLLHLFPIFPHRQYLDDAP